MILAGVICSYCAGYGDLPIQVTDDLGSRPMRHEKCPHCLGTGLEPEPRATRLVIYSATGNGLEAAVNACLTAAQKERRGES